MAPSLPLTGITVVELSTSVAGPFGGQVLAELGADVIKIENPDGGDDARHWGPPFAEGAAALFNALNRNKRSAAIALRDEAQRAMLRRFILDRADVVLQNLRPGLVERYGLDAASLRAEKPSLIYCNIGAYGATGPKRMLPGYDPLMQACSGIMSVTGLEGTEPVRVGPSIVDQGTAMWAVTGVLAALFRRAATGEGCAIDTSLYETAIGWLPVQFATYLASGSPPKRAGSEIAGIVPYKAYQAADGWLVIAAGNDNLFRRLAVALDVPELAADARFRHNPDRVANRDAVNQTIARIVATDTVAAWVDRLAEAGVPCAPVQSIDAVVDDPQFAAVEMLQDTPDGRLSLIGVPLRFDGARPPLRAGPPALGAATAAILDPET